jgi:hypothetical protein
MRERKEEMKKSLFAALLATLVMVAGANADSLHLRPGRTTGEALLGATASQFQSIGAEAQLRIPTLAAVEAATSVVPPAAPLPAPAANPKSVTVPGGTIISVRMRDSLDTRTTKTGALFTATLDSNLVGNNGVVVARRGTVVHGKVIKSANARRLTGKSELQLELIDIVINGTSYSIRTSGVQQKGASEGARTARKTAGGAGLGAIIGAIAGGAGKGAAIGATAGLGISMVKKGQPIQVPSETLLQFALSGTTTLPVAH